MAQVNSENTTSTAIDQTRRRFLTQAAGVAAGGAALALATIPPASAATAPAASGEPDPIFAAIERHKAAAVPRDAAVDVRSNFNDLHMTAEQREQCDRLDGALEDAVETCEQAGADLINTAPTTLAGIVAAIQSLRLQMLDDGTYMPQTFVLQTGGDAQNTMGWIDAWLDTLADAAAELDRAGKAVQS